MQEASQVAGPWACKSTVSLPLLSNSAFGHRFCRHHSQGGEAPKQ